MTGAGYVIPEPRCKRCKAPFEERENLLTGKPMWFPTCKHSARDYELVNNNGEIVDV